jgi:hypothetical protein
MGVVIFQPIFLFYFLSPDFSLVESFLFKNVVERMNNWTVIHDIFLVTLQSRLREADHRSE